MSNPNDYRKKQPASKDPAFQSSIRGGPPPGGFAYFRDGKLVQQGNFNAPPNHEYRINGQQVTKAEYDRFRKQGS
jgi:hypothetical protein